MTTQRILPTCAILLVVACTTPNPNYRHREAAMEDAALSCPDQVTCSGAMAVCNTAIGKCVQCTPDQKAACTGSTPICSTDNTCRGCTEHSQCASSSNVCRPDGGCAAEGEVAYVQQGAPGNECTKNAPCSLLSTALEKNKTYVKISGTITEPNTIRIDQKTFILLAEPRTLTSSGAKLTSSFEGILLELKGGSTLSIYDLEISGATGDVGYAVSMPANNLPSTLSLHRATLRNNLGGAIIAGGGTLNITQSTISRNPGGGVTTERGSTLNITRSDISMNAGGGIKMNGPTMFNIVNNFIVGNGNIIDSRVGGIKAYPKDNTAKLEFNTIVGNQVRIGDTTAAGGVQCSVDGFTYNNNLLYQNLYQNGDRQTIGLCSSGNSFLQVDLTNARFRGGTDFHLTAETPAPAIRDALKVVDCAGNAEDYDGDQRPQGGGCDLGADEYVAPKP